jgi:ketosteroid isomerase-like protein
VSAADVVAELWRRIQARDWDGVGELLAEDVVLEWPSELVQIRGRANFVDFNRFYPEGWSIEVLRIVGAEDTAVSEVRVPHATLGVYLVVSLFDVEGGRIARGREYWSDERYVQPAPDRARFFEPIPASRRPR